MEYSCDYGGYKESMAGTISVHISTWVITTKGQNTKSQALIKIHLHGFQVSL